MEDCNRTKKLARNKSIVQTLLLLLLAISSSATSIHTTPSDLFTNNLTVTVLDGNSNEPLIGVIIFSDDQKIVEQTDVDGKAVIDISHVGHRDIINFQYLGYLTLKLPVFEIRKQKGIVKLYTSNVLDSVVVVGRRDDPEDEIPFRVQRISRRQLEFTNTQTAADALQQHGDVFVQKTQMGGGSPVLRGFEANRVLLVLDGVRMNNAIYRNGHLQNAITVDNGILEQVEVIFGPGSLMYGSDALGGVVHYRTRDPQLLRGKSGQDYEIKTNVSTRFSSANNEKSAHFDLDYRARRWASISSITYSDYGDLRAGANRPDDYPELGLRNFYIFRNENLDEKIRSKEPDIQVGTAYSQIDFLQKIRFQPHDSLYFILNVQYSTSSDIPRYDRLTEVSGSTPRDLKWSEFFYGPQQRLWGSLKMRSIKSKGLYSRATFIGGAQFIAEDRLKRKWNKIERTFNLEDVFVYSFTADLDKYLDPGQNHQLSYGIDAQHNIVQSEAGNRNIFTGRIVFDEPTRYPNGGSEMTSLGAYLNYKWKVKNTGLTLQAGGRYSYVRLKAKFEQSETIAIQWPEDYLSGIGSENSAVTWGLGLTWNSQDQWQVRISGASAFRSPNIDDFGKVREKDGFITVPNPDLKPETSINGELTIGKTIGQKEAKARLHLSSTGFYTLLSDALVRRLGALPNGDSTFLYEGDYPVIQQNFNASSGFVYGFSGNLRLDLGKKWQVFSSISYTKGRTEFVNEVVDTLVPLSHIPPMYGRTGLRFQGEKLQLEANIHYNGAKPLDEYGVGNIKRDDPRGPLVYDYGGTSDNLEESGTCQTVTVNGVQQTICEGSLAWSTLNFYLSYRLNAKISLNLAVENALDTHYRPFSSGLSGPGRNFIVGLRGRF
ncbi:MAG: TonB-dependent receptor [Bacteroidota bacterium]